MAIGSRFMAIGSKATGQMLRGKAIALLAAYLLHDQATAVRSQGLCDLSGGWVQFNGALRWSLPRCASRMGVTCRRNKLPRNVAHKLELKIH